MLRTLAKARALSLQSNWVVSPQVEWVTAGMLHAWVVKPWYQKSDCKVLGKIPHMLKNPFVVFYWSRNHWALPQEAKLSDPTNLSIFLVAIKICRPHYCVPSHFLFHPHFMFILSPISCSSPEYIWNIATWRLKPNNQSINQKYSMKVKFKKVLLDDIYVKDLDYGQIEIALKILKSIFFLCFSSFNFCEFNSLNI